MSKYSNSIQALIKHFQGYDIQMFHDGDWCDVPKALNWDDTQFTTFRVKPKVLTTRAKLVFDGMVAVDYKESDYNIEATFTDGMLTNVKYIK